MIALSLVVVRSVGAQTIFWEYMLGVRKSFASGDAEKSFLLLVMLVLLGNKSHVALLEFSDGYWLRAETMLQCDVEEAAGGPFWV